MRETERDAMLYDYYHKPERLALRDATSINARTRSRVTNNARADVISLDFTECKTDYQRTRYTPPPPPVVITTTGTCYTGDRQCPPGAVAFGRDDFIVFLSGNRTARVVDTCKSALERRGQYHRFSPSRLIFDRR